MSDRGSRVRRTLVAFLLAGLLSAPAATLAGAQPAAAVDLPVGAVIVVVGTGDPGRDPANVQAAVDRAHLSGAGTVQLVGTFEFGACALCVVVPGPVTISGTGDPSVTDPSASPTTVIRSSGHAPFAILDTGSPLGHITIERIWFDGASTLAVLLLQVRGTFSMFDNRVSGVVPGKEFRFAVAGGAPGPVPTEASQAAEAAFTRLGTLDGPKLTGAVVFDGNYIDNNLPMTVGDDNAFAFAQCHLSRIQITNNFIRAGEAVEIEGCRGPGAVYLIARNTIVQTDVVSNLAQETKAPGFVRHGGHPAAIKPIDAEATLIVIRDNWIDSRKAYRSAVCIMTGDGNDDSATIVEGNTCLLNGQFAAILGGWAGTPNFFNPFYLQNATIRGNRFVGKALLGIALMDFTYLRNDAQAVVNRGHDNVMYRNDVSRFVATRAAVYLGPQTHDNVIVEDVRGRLVDQGTDNTVDRRPYARAR